jgi:hypothetical protein
MLILYQEKELLVVIRLTCPMHVSYARRAYILPTLQQRIERTSIHQPTTHTYRNAVILVPVVKACIPTRTSILAKQHISYSDPKNHLDSFISSYDDLLGHGLAFGKLERWWWRG